MPNPNPKPNLTRSLSPKLAGVYLPLALPYLLVYVDDAYSTTIIGNVVRVRVRLSAAARARVWVGARATANRSPRYPPEPNPNP